MKFTILIILLISLNNLFSQQIEHYDIPWGSNIKIGSNKALYFKGALYDENYLPLFIQNITVSESDFEVELINKKFITVSDQESNFLNKDMLNNMIFVFSDTYNDRGKKKLSIKLIPLRFNIEYKSVEKLISFDLKIRPVSKTKQLRRRLTEVDVSEMSSGDWFKIGVVKTGVYKITYNDLLNLGIERFDAPRVYGYGGGVLSEYNADNILDDMNELAIDVERGDDGVFNNGDYILFYAEGPLTWTYDDMKKQFKHKTHLYSDTIFYFLSFNTGDSKRIALKAQNTNSAKSINVFLDKQVHEKNDINLLKTGKQWLGEKYNNLNESHNFNFSFPNIVSDSLSKIQTLCVARSPIYSYMKVYYQNKNIETVTIPSVDMSSATGYYAKQAVAYDSFYPKSSNLTIATQYDQYSQYEAWLDYIEVSAVRQLKMSESQLLFTNVYNWGGVNAYTITNTNTSQVIWDVTNFTDVHRVNCSSENSKITFKDDVENYKTYISFQPSLAYRIASIRKVRNQNLHALSNVEYVILTHKNFKSQAEKIANFHRTQTGLNTVVVTNEEVYNEFSSGTPDITAIKEMMRHLYHHRSFTDTLKYLMLFGDGSYDNKTQSSSNSNYVLTFQSKESFNNSNSLVCDDYYGLLDDDEGVLIGYLDIGIGRLVVKDVSEANSAVNKILNYNSSKESYGNWRSVINFVADNGDRNLHISDADDVANLVENKYPQFNLNKIYIDAYPLEVSSGGNIVPEATHDFNNAINKGTLILNYTGHGGELGLAHEQLTTLQDIKSWNNINRLATFLTATCEFTRYDDKNRTSAGEYVFLNPKGGGISLFTTTRIAYAAPNKVLNTAFYNHLFDDNTFRMGDLIRRTKNALGTSNSNMRNFTLIGDPALSLAIPRKKVETYKINEVLVNDVDTFNITPLSKVTIEGRVTDNNNQLMTNFNGIVYPTVFDKSDTIYTLCQYECSSSFPFKSRKSVIYKGKASVKNGKFSFAFIVPKDISYKNGLGRISYYADDKSDDAWGYNNKISISGVSDTNIVDNKGPDIELFMNDENFIYGGTTDENPTFIASLFDESGINTVGNGIGHDLTAKLNNDNRKLSVLNSYYESDLDSYQSGKVSYPYSKLEVGRNEIYFKAWDVFNNSSEQSIEFFVAESNELAIKNIFNYPNPFTTNTDFYFDHNQANINLDVLIQIFTISGKLVKTIETNIITDGFRSTPINWDGRDDFNDRIGRGVYIYKLKVRTEDGKVATEFQKLVILK